jgi:hypothetical protein
MYDAQLKAPLRPGLTREARTPTPPRNVAWPPPTLLGTMPGLLQPFDRGPDEGRADGSENRAHCEQHHQLDGLCRTFIVYGAAQSGAVVGTSTEIALHSLCVTPQLAQRNRRRSPIVRGDHGSELIVESSIMPSQTGHGRLN